MRDLHKLQQLNLENLAYDTTYFAKKIKGMIIKDTSNYVKVDSGLPTFNFNIITLLRHLKKDSQENILADIHSFNEKNFPINIWCYEHQLQMIQFLQTIGLQEYETTYIAMVAPLYSIKQANSSQSKLFIKKVSTLEEFEEFGRVLSTLYKDDRLEAKSIREYYRQVGQLPTSTITDADLYIGILNNKIVSIGALTYKEKTVGMYHIATLEEYRGQGLGTEMVNFLLTKAKKSDATYCTLQSSPSGKSIYEKFGFRSIGSLKVFENKHLIN